MKESSSNPALVIVLVVLLVISLIVHLATWLPDKNSPRGFVLPDGDADAGVVAFEKLACARCHTLHGVNFKDTEAPSDFEKVALGGEVLQPIPYGKLVTAIIHPNESIRPSVDDRFTDPAGRSLMLDLNNQMTTQQLIDIVTLLQDHYEVVSPALAPDYLPYR